MTPPVPEPPIPPEVLERVRAIPLPSPENGWIEFLTVYQANIARALLAERERALKERKHIHSWESESGLATGPYSCYCGAFK